MVAGLIQIIKSTVQNNSSLPFFHCIIPKNDKIPKISRLICARNVPERKS